MILTSLILAGCTVACAVLIFMKLPRFLKRFMVKHSLATDIFATVGTWFMLSSISGSVIAALASAMSGVGVSGLLFNESKKVETKK